MKITRRTIKLVIGISLGIVFLIGAVGVHRFISHRRNEVKALKKIITRLEADSRVAEVLVTEVVEDRVSGKTLTTIKFLEYDTNDIPLKPQYFTFAGNIIQFQSLVIRFEDSFVRGGHSLKGRSAYLF